MSSRCCFLSYVGGRSLPFVLAAVFSVLLLAGFYLSPPGVDPPGALISRAGGGFGVMGDGVDDLAPQKDGGAVHKLSRAVEHSPVSIVITDKAGNIEYVNPKFTE